MNIIELLDPPIAFHRCLAEITGSANAGLLLSQAIYWQNRPNRDDPSGWWYKTRDDWYKETSLSRKELETARRACAGILLHKKKGIPPRTYYKIDVEELEKRLLALPSRSEPIIRTETGRMNGPKRAVCLDRNGPSISTETNPETNAEIKVQRDKGFVKPLIDDVIAYGKEIGLPDSECRDWHDHYSANGWMVGRAKMSDWKAAVRYWNSNYKKNTYGKRNKTNVGTGQQSLILGQPDYSKGF